MNFNAPICFFSVRVRVLAMNENLKPVTEGHVTIDIVVCYSIGHMALMFCTCVFIFAWSYNYFATSVHV